MHEIKAPIADIYLLCERRRDDTARRILAQNRRTENYVDMALFYARSDQVYQDYLIREATLQQTAEEVLQKTIYGPASIARIRSIPTQNGSLSSWSSSC